VGLPIVYSFSHGDGTIDKTAESRAYYERPGNYDVKLRWEYFGAQGTTDCGTVKVRSANQPVPDPPQSLRIDCRISDDQVVVNEIITLTAFHAPATEVVGYTFEHGDGTLDSTATSRAYYAAPGYYEVKLQWVYDGQSGTMACGTVTVAPNAADFVGITTSQAEALGARIVRIDDQFFPHTQEYLPFRVNVEIDNGVVTRAYLG